MPKRTAQAKWEGKLKDGRGTVQLGSGAFEGNYSFSSRFEHGTGTNPEELIGAAHAGCFSMALSKMLEDAGYPPENIRTCAEVQINKTEEGFAITDILLSTEAAVPAIEADKFQELAQKAKDNCPVSKALAGASIQLQANLKQ